LPDAFVFVFERFGKAGGVPLRGVRASTDYSRSHPFSSVWRMALFTRAMERLIRCIAVIESRSRSWLTEVIPCMALHADVTRFA
jgi:hypothetical protein